MARLLLEHDTGRPEYQDLMTAARQVHYRDGPDTGAFFI